MYMRCVIPHVSDYESSRETEMPDHEWRKRKHCQQQTPRTCQCVPWSIRAQSCQEDCPTLRNRPRGRQNEDTSFPQSNAAHAAHPSEHRRDALERTPCNDGEFPSQDRGNASLFRATLSQSTFPFRRSRRQLTGQYIRKIHRGRRKRIKEDKRGCRNMN